MRVSLLTSTKNPLTKYTPSSIDAADPTAVASKGINDANEVPEGIVMLPYCTFSFAINGSPS